MRTAEWGVIVLLLTATPAFADCASDAKASLESRLTVLPLRETLDSERDGEHQRIVLELETLHRFHTLIEGLGDKAVPGIELLILDGKGWSKEQGRWQPFAAAAATAESTAEDEQSLADQLTDGAEVTCLGAVDQDGRSLTGFELKLDADPSSGAPYTTMHLYIDPKTGLPHSLDMSGQGEAGPAVTRQTFEYAKGLKLTAPQ